MLELRFTDQESAMLIQSFQRLNKNAMPRITRAEFSMATSPERLSTLALEKLGKLVEFLTKAIEQKPDLSDLYLRCKKLVAYKTVDKVIQFANKVKLHKFFTKDFCRGLIALTENYVSPDNYCFFRLPAQLTGDSLSRISIVSDLFAYIKSESLSLRTLRQIHMTDRLGVLFLTFVAARNTPFEYRIGDTQITLGKGSKTRNTDAGHCSLLTQLERKPRENAEAPFDKKFVLDWYLYLGMNLTHEIPKNDNVSIDKAIENRTRPLMVRELNCVAQGEDLFCCFERAVAAIYAVTTALEGEYEGDQLQALREQKQGMFNVLDPATNKVDPEFYRMQGRQISKKSLKKKLAEHTWTALDPSDKNKVVKFLQKQIHKHPSKPLLEKKAPSLIGRLE